MGPRKVHIERYSVEYGDIIRKYITVDYTRQPANRKRRVAEVITPRERLGAGVVHAPGTAC